ncbi:MAG: lactonase family protein, partial [Clostridiaceae bacterium]|nr:lactonase family protein [Clostridiaceae bacterium]
DKNMLFFVGSYTRLGGPGIAVCSLEGTRIQVEQTVALPNPTYLILSRGQDRLIAISSEAADQSEGGSYAMFDLVGGRLVMRGRYNTGAAGPCHLCLSPDERFLYTANYASGTLSVFPLDPPGPRIQLIRHLGHSVHPERQASAHVHHVSFLPQSQILAAVDLGLDQVVLYRQHPHTGLLERSGQMACSPGMGPRHLAYGPGDTAYLVHELGNAVSRLVIAGDTLSMRETWPTLPGDWQGENTCAAIRVAGSHVFASNRGHDSLAAFRMLPDGQLRPAGTFSSLGALPRDFSVLSDNRVLVANQGGSVTLLDWDPRAGQMTGSASMPLPGAVCVCPLLDP